MRSPAKKKTVRNSTGKPAAPRGGTSTERPHQQAIMHRLRRVEGQIRGVLMMMEAEQPCDEIAQQLSAARKALDRAFYEMIACSLEMEVRAAPNDHALSERIAETTRLLAKYS